MTAGRSENDDALQRLQFHEMAGPRAMFDHMLAMAHPAPPRGTEPPAWTGERPSFPSSSMVTAGSSTCPRCDGSGDDPDGGTCVMCHGHKTI